MTWPGNSARALVKFKLHARKSAAQLPDVFASNIEAFRKFHVKTYLLYYVQV